MTPLEKAEAIPRLRQAGNELYAQGQWFEAAAKYEEALNLIEQLSLSEKPGDPEHVRLDQMRVPFYVNMAQCQFKLKVSKNLLPRLPYQAIVSSQVVASTMPRTITEPFGARARR